MVYQYFPPAPDKRQYVDDRVMVNRFFFGTFFGRCRLVKHDPLAFFPKLNE